MSSLGRNILRQDGLNPEPMCDVKKENQVLNPKLQSKASNVIITMRKWDTEEDNDDDVLHGMV